MGTKRKLANVFAFKALGDEEPDGTFEAVVSVFDNRDHHGDVVRPGAYRDAIAKMKRSKTPWPVVWSHRHGDLDAIVGQVLDAAEIKGTDQRIPADAPAELKSGGGLWVKGRIDDLGEDFSAKLWKRMKDGRVVQWSFAYDVLDGGWIVEDGVESFELRKLDVLEVGPALLGANDATRTLAMKARDAGKSNLAKAIETFGALAATVEELDADVDFDSIVDELEGIAGTSDGGSVDLEVSGTVDLDEAALDAVATAAASAAEAAVRAALGERSTNAAGGAATVTDATEGKARGKATDDRSGGKAADDRTADDPRTSAQLAELELMALEVGAIV